ncbi:uncharacterized protein LOC124170367 [Ischnura elegans]|uniref:uncharacterized protein LOC124170367 n=1 Tax=Ischnura elegans TaxID=197161 RepID=UPI001ED8BF3A|nr:uncharacterized protein LOC124170367 [Ischnura elegans]
MALKRSLRKKAEADKPDIKPTGRACLPYVSTISNKIARILRRHNVETIQKPLGKLKALLGTTKDKLGLKTSGVYRIPCECGQVCIGETGRTIEKRLKEHERCIRLYYPYKSVVAEHSLENGHRINFQDTKLICQAKNYWARVVKEAVEIRLEGKNMNRDSGFHLSYAWKPALKNLKGERTRIGPTVDQSEPT